MKILITGGYGQLGHCIYDTLQNPLILINNEYLFASHSEFDITDEGSMERYLFYHPDIECIINCAAYTNVDEAENDLYSVFKVNSLGVYKLVKICEKYDIMLFHISTDYVYKDGQGICNELSAIEPVNKYGESKRDGELHIINSHLNHWYIFRTSWLYSYYPGNFFTRILDKCHNIPEEINVVQDETGSPTYAKCLSEIFICIIEHGYYATTFKNGIYNVSGNGMCSRYDFAANIIAGGNNIIVNGKTINVKRVINPIKQEDLKLPAKRPHCIIMDNQKFYNVLPIQKEHWLYDLQDCITEYEKRLNEENNKYRIIYGKDLYRTY